MNYYTQRFPGKDKNKTTTQNWHISASNRTAHHYLPRTLGSSPCSQPWFCKSEVGCRSSCRLLPRQAQQQLALFQMIPRKKSWTWVEPFSLQTQTIKKIANLCLLCFRPSGKMSFLQLTCGKNWQWIHVMSDTICTILDSVAQNFRLNKFENQSMTPPGWFLNWKKWMATQKQHPNSNPSLQKMWYKSAIKNEKQIGCSLRLDSLWWPPSER